uniref:EF-hand domain-containing protein n=1 Tax=Amphimedon queenslandica TaxID=400682 RepID=A0A1X7VG52_AMPQE
MKQTTEEKSGSIDYDGFQMLLDKSESFDACLAIEIVAFINKTGKVCMCKGNSGSTMPPSPLDDILSSATVPIPDSLSGYRTSQTALAVMMIFPVCYQAGMLFGLYNNNTTMAKFCGMYDQLGDKVDGTLG